MARANPLKNNNYPFLQGGGEMGELIRSFNWESTPVGPPGKWPQSLCTTLGIILHSAFPHFLFWGDDLICFYNDAFRPSLGIDGKHPAIGQKGREVWAELWDFAGPLIRGVMATGESVWFENQLVPFYRNGQIEHIYWTFSYSPAYGDNGQINGVFVTCYETTETVKNLQKTAESEQRFRTMAEGSDILIAMSDATSNAIYFNKAWIEMTGRSMADLLEFGWVDLVHPDDKERYVNIYLSAFNKQVAFTGEFRVLSKNGDYRWLLAKGPPRFSPDGSFEGYISSCIDITDRKQEEEEKQQLLNSVKENERRLELILNQLPAHVLILRGSQQIIETINNSVLEYWKKEKYNTIGKPLLEVLPELEGQVFPEQLKTVLETGITIAEKEIPMIFNTPDGGQRQTYVDYIYEPLTDAAGNRTGVLVMSFEVTDKVASRKLLETFTNELQAINEELTASNEELAATNEELAAVNEEMTSTNEELIATQASLQQVISSFEESESRMRSMVASAPFPIGVYVGREMRILLANKAIMDVWGKGYEVIGKGYAEILPELANQAIFAQLDTVFTTGIPFHARNQQVDLMIDGELQVYYFNYSFTPLLDTNGDVYGVMNTAADVTDLNIAKQKVEQSERNLYYMIAQAPVAMCILSGPEHVITVANDQIIELWGKQAGAVMNKPVFDALPDARNQGLEQLMADVYHTGEAFHANEMPVSLLRKGKLEKVYQNFVYQPYRDANGTILGIIAITIDVTEQVLARQKIQQNETELLATQQRLEQELEAGKQLQRQKDDFIGMASHELKTPLTSLTAIIQVAQLKLKNSEDLFLAGAMAKANTQVKRMANMINGFLNISRLESGKILIEKQYFNITRLIEEVIEEIKMVVTTHQINLYAPDLREIYADRDKISSVISNLISNAVKYSPKGREIEVRCWQAGTEVIVSVKDEGMGINPQDIEKIFDRYYRVEATHMQHIAGFGIGLYLSAEIIKRHNGRIWAESESGVGSTFCFSLPVSKPNL